jgi:hypothetical protein
MGMGLHFGELAPEHLATLRQWLPADETGMQHANA